MASVRKIGLALDADYLVFSALSAAEVETDWGDDQWTLICDHAQAKRALEARVQFFKDEIKAKFKGGKCTVECIFVFSDPDSSANWRLKLLETYKFNRKLEGKRKPTGYSEFVKRVVNTPEEFGGVDSIVGQGNEADDVCATLATAPEEHGYDMIIPVSVDKDFKTIPCYFFHLKMDKTPHEILHIDLESADYWHLYQGMKGDITDGFAGIKGVGEQVDGQCIHQWLRNPTYLEQYEHEFKTGARKGTTELRWRSVKPEDHTNSLWDCIVSVGAKAGMTEAEVLIGFQMARLTRYGEPEVWTPKLSEHLLGS